jgi:hypothetical protein
MIGGHQHCDHIGGLDEVINAGYDVRIQSYYNGSFYQSNCVTSWNAAASGTTAGAPVVPTAGSQIPLGNGATGFVAVNGSIAGGGTVSVSDENDRSIAVLVQYGGFDWLWASDLGGGNIDNACTSRSTTQVDVETAVVQAISPGGAFPLISSGGIQQIQSCEHCHPADGEIPFDWLLAEVTGKRGPYEFMLSEPARCPRTVNIRSQRKPWWNRRVISGSVSWTRLFPQTRRFLLR